MLATNRGASGRPLRAAQQRPKESQAGRANRASAVLGFASLLLSALLVSIVIEWLGIAFWWKEEGLQHSINMVTVEAGYLNSDFTEGKKRFSYQ